MNLWTTKEKVGFPSVPVKVVDIELSHPLLPLDGLGDYRGVQALVRLHGRPLGYIEKPLIAGSCSTSLLKETILAELGEAILRYLLFERLAAPMESNQFCIEDLIKKEVPVHPREYFPLVTVAICTRDRTSYLRSCLDALNRLEYPRLELLVVDNAPRDDSTERLVRTIYPNIQYVREPRPGLNWARNRVIAEARGEIIAYADDDVVVDPGWVKALVDDFMETPEIMAVTGLVVPYELETETQVLFERRFGLGRGFERRWYPADRRNGGPMAKLYSASWQFGTGANMAFRRVLFDQINYFDPALDCGTVTRGGGDVEMFFRVLKEGRGLLYEPGAIVRHRHRRSHSELRIQLMNWTIGFGSFLMRSALAYPDERTDFVRKGLWWLWQTNIRRPMGSLIDPHHLPWDIILAEAYGSLIGPLCYLMARSTAVRIEDTFGPLHRTVILNSPTFANSMKKFGKNIGIFSMDLEQPLPILSDAAEYSLVRIMVYWKGRQLVAFEIPNCYQSIAAARLRKTIVDHLGLRLMDPECKKSLDDLKAESYAALARHFKSLENGG